ncbi:MAG TPA: hypothetical protein VFI79_00725 [Gemmatimonadales bacterium]|nr:hypothetical protein [Gemmatimonadales bacterium]
MRRRTGGLMKRRSDGRTVGSIVAPPIVALLLLAARPPERLTAQTPQDTQPRAPAAQTDTLHQVGPVGALWRSLLVPGWGQAVTGRNVTGALFGIWEGTTMYMTLKAQQEANYFKASNSPNLHAKRQEVQDWLVLWGFNHLFAGAEAFVAAHLRDFPKDLRVQAVPGGVGVSFPLPHP